MENFWEFKAWGTYNLIAVLLLSLLAANMLRKNFKLLRESLIPTSVLGGGILIVIAGIYKLVTGETMFDTEFFGGNGTANLELITYHTLALGFIASTFKTSDKKMNKKRMTEIFNTGVTTVATYLLQAVVGLGITMVAAMVMTDFFPAAGILLPFGYGQGTGQAMNYGMIYENDFGFAGGKSFGLTVAALGFLSASIGGVVHLNIRKKDLKARAKKAEEGAIQSEQIQADNEIPMQDSVDKLTIQVALVAGAYLLSYLLMFVLGGLLPGMKSVIFGFNFLLGVLAATLVKAVINLLKQTNIVRKEYTNNFLMTRVSNFFFDIMVVAGIAAIRLGVLKEYWGILMILGVVGLIITYWYNRIVAKTLFKEYQEEQFLTMYGMLTGTASTGIILLREIDGDFKTPAADNMVYQNFPAIVFGFPLMLLATLAPVNPLLTLGILAAFFLVMNIVLFRSKIFVKK
ncbi:MAG: hypothetical protein J6C98_07425 [Oscillospiraceae bacterium]|nr:hypothetical protein [Oscillospiraceae bacterium]